MSKITNDGLTRSGTGRFTVDVKRLKRSHPWWKINAVRRGPSVTWSSC